MRTCYFQLWTKTNIFSPRSLKFLCNLIPLVSEVSELHNPNCTTPCAVPHLTHFIAKTKFLHFQWKQCAYCRRRRVEVDEVMILWHVTKFLMKVVPPIVPKQGSQQSHSWAYTPRKPELKETHVTPMFIAALFIIVRTWKQPRCPSADEWIKKMLLLLSRFSRVRLCATP